MEEAKLLFYSTVLDKIGPFISLPMLKPEPAQLTLTVEVQAYAPEALTHFI